MSRNLRGDVRTSRAEQKKQSRQRSKNFSEEKSLEKTLFIAIDGEGKNDPSKQFFYEDGNGNTIENVQQDYVLLCASTGEYLEDLKGLSTSRILSWLCNLSLKYPKACFVGFGTSYDVTMWLRDMDYHSQKYLREYCTTDEKTRHDEKMTPPFSDVYQLDDIPHVECRDWVSKPTTCAFELNYLQRKSFECTCVEVENVGGNDYRPRYEKCVRKKRDGSLEEYSRRMRHGKFEMFDVFGFFQSRFVAALEEHGLLSQADEEFLSHMKDSRSDLYEIHTPETVRRYCMMECAYLVNLMEKLEGDLHHPEIALSLKRWDGAGAIAKALFKKFNVVEHLDRLPEPVQNASQYAFSGGRIELVQYGHVEGDFFDYDINSAYPSTMISLPSLKDGEWRLESTPVGMLSLCHVKWDLKERAFYPFFWRRDDGMIIYPPKGENWVWRPEIDVALKHAHADDKIEVVECWNFYPTNEIKPFAFVDQLARQRLEWKQLARKSGGREGGQHIAVKLGINSLYGTLAQQIGAVHNKETDELEAPKYHNIALAGYITSATRALVYDAAMQDVESVVMFATDGLFCTKPRDVEIDTGLGAWEVTTCKTFTGVQSGVYWTDTEKKSIIKSRGFEKGSITEEEVLQAWKSKSLCVQGTSKKFVTFGILATGQEELWTERNFYRLGGWEVVSRDLQLRPSGKRMDDPDLPEKKWAPWKSLIPTKAASIFDYCGEETVMSSRYELIWIIPDEDLTSSQKQFKAEVEEKKEWSSL